MGGRIVAIVGSILIVLFVLALPVLQKGGISNIKAEDFIISIIVVAVFLVGIFWGVKHHREQ